MKTRAWIILASITVVLIAIAMIALIVFVPQSKALFESEDTEYDNVSKYDYTAVIDKDRTPNSETYSVTESIVNEGIADDDYIPGNSNPFTPSSELTIYNEPSLVTDTTSTTSGGTKTITGTETK